VVGTVLTWSVLQGSGDRRSLVNSDRRSLVNGDRRSISR